MRFVSLHDLSELVTPHLRLDWIRLAVLNLRNPDNAHLPVMRIVANDGHVVGIPEIPTFFVSYAIVLRDAYLSHTGLSTRIPRI